MSRTRSDLHRVAAHILGRRRFQVSGHFGLRASPAGIATPAFGSDPEVLRVAGLNLVREVGTQCRTIPLSGSTLTQLAAFVDADLGAEFSAGANAPALGPVDAPLDLDADELDAVFQWFDLAWRVLDGIADAAVLGTGWATIQLWPEHFNVGSSLDRGQGRGVNLGFSAGDGFSEEAYAYVGPWESERPGDAAYWNAPFGAFLPRSAAGGRQGCDEFLRRGLDLLAAA